MKVCIACGMPMKTKEDFAMQDTNKEYCVYCAKPDGTMRDFEETKEGLTNFMIETQGIDKEVALEVTLQSMRKLPVWKEYFK